MQLLYCGCIWRAQSFGSFLHRLHLDEAHNPGPPPNHLGWSSFPEEMADASASVKADYDFFDAVQAPNIPNLGEGVEPDPVIQGVSNCW